MAPTPQIIITSFPILAPESSNLPLFSASPITPVWPMAPILALCSLGYSSTLFTESISFSKYPEAYGAYQQRVAMFVPFLTPVWGLLLKARGGNVKVKVENLVWGQSEAVSQDKKKQ